jgi:hypothetical protein
VPVELPDPPPSPVVSDPSASVGTIDPTTRPASTAAVAIRRAALAPAPSSRPSGRLRRSSRWCWSIHSRRAMPAAGATVGTRPIPPTIVLTGTQ